MTETTLPRLDAHVDDAPLLADALLPRIAAACADAREWLGKILEAWGADPDLIDAAVLLLSEVFTNSVRHAIGIDFDTRITASFWHGHLRITVSDPDPRFYAADLDDDEHGRGLAIVDQLAERWGIAPNGTGKITFFELYAGGAK